MSNEQQNAKVTAAQKKAYAKPDFEYERVFETMALKCGKMSSTGSNCRNPRFS